MKELSEAFVCCIYFFHDCTKGFLKIKKMNSLSLPPSLPLSHTHTHTHTHTYTHTHTHTCKFFFAAVSHTFLQVLQLVFDLLILPLCLLALPPANIRTHIHQHPPHR